jgi:long-chain acyl-CoA synthetase
MEAGGGRGGFARAGQVRRIERTCRATLARAGGLARRLTGSGVEPGHRVLILMDDGPDWIAAFAACLAVGAVAVPLESSSSSAFAQAVARRCRARALLCDGSHSAVPFDGPSIISSEIGLEEEGPLRPMADPDPGDLAEIVFTSGTTAEPRGVMISHGNILAALAGIEAGILKRRRMVGLVSPLTILSLVPLSHLFGQALGFFIPVVLGARVVFTAPRSPRAIFDLARREKAWVMVMVPRHLAALRDHLSMKIPGRPGDLSSRWWIRALRSIPAVREHGWRMRALVVGGARLDPRLERYFKDLGYLVIQGYGLTETAPIVSVSNPFDNRVGLVGRPGRVQEVRIADDGEILVRGENVTSGYYEDPEATRLALEGGWLRTGDLGVMEPDGSLRFLGRKKEVIVTAEGQNVFPDEVEEALRAQETVADCAVFASGAGGGEKVQAAIIPEAREGAVKEAVASAVASANASLAPHQRVRAWTLWVHPDFPRTPTGKVLRRVIARQAAASPGAGGSEEGGPGDSPEHDPLTRLRRLAGPEARADQRLAADLGLSSIDVAELTAEIEERYQVEVDPATIHDDVSLQELIRGARPAGAAATPWPMPRWARRPAARLARSFFQAVLVFPALRLFVRLSVRGRARHETGGWPAGPVVIAANHASYMDAPVLLASIPRWRRRRVAVAMQPEHFEPWLLGEAGLVTRFHMGWQYGLLSLLLHTFPFPRSAAFKVALEYAGGMVDEGWSILVFPEGVLSPDGAIHPFRPGVGVLARDLGLPVLPVRIRGTREILPPDGRFPRKVRAPVDVAWGEPLEMPRGEGPADFAARVEAAIRAL